MRPRKNDPGSSRRGSPTTRRRSDSRPGPVRLRIDRARRATRKRRSFSVATSPRVVKRSARASSTGSRRRCAATSRSSHGLPPMRTTGDVETSTCYRGADRVPEVSREPRPPGLRHPARWPSLWRHGEPGKRLPAGVLPGSTVPQRGESRTQHQDPDWGHSGAPARQPRPAREAERETPSPQPRRW